MRDEPSLTRGIPKPRPRFISGDGPPLFAWHHAPAGHLRRGAALVLCPPLGYEYMSAYATWRRLALRLASVGFDVLRVDYETTGDSSGACDEPCVATSWIRSVVRAVTEARRVSGANRVGLIGLRGGALLALHGAVQSGGVERLVLWGPLQSGRALVRELKAFAGFFREDHTTEDDDTAINAAGYLFTRETVDALSRLSLDALSTPPADEILVVDRDDRPTHSPLCDGLRRLGSRVTTICPPGTAAMLAPPQDSTVAEQATADITNWLCEWPPVSAQRAITDESARDAAMASWGNYTERAVCFGPGDRLFGIITSPTDNAYSASSVLLLNTGVEYHIGPSRLYVPLAREWAAQGHLVLRYDLGGIGDSAPPEGAEDANAAYPAHLLDDLREAIALVRTTSPNRDIIVAGLCSGGWAAFRAAREGLDVNAIVSINAPLYLRDGLSGVTWRAELDELERYRHSIRDPLKWMKALRGDAAYASFVRTIRSAIRRRVLTSQNKSCGEKPSHGLTADLDAIADRGIRTLFVFSEKDSSLEYFQMHAGTMLQDPGAHARFRYEIVPAAGHSFRPRAAQQRLRDLLTAFVSRS